MEIDKLIPVSESKAYTGLNRTALYERIARGELQAVKVGSRTFISESEIRRFRDHHTKTIGRTIPKRGEAA